MIVRLVNIGYFFYTHCLDILFITTILLLLVSLDCPFLIVHSVFSNVYFHYCINGQIRCDIHVYLNHSLYFVVL
jgi:hypothetical protein